MAKGNPAKTKKKLFGPGTLVRIKNLSNFALFDDGEFVCESLIQERNHYTVRASTLQPNQTFKELFYSLPLDISPQQSYVAEIVQAIYSPGSTIPSWVGVKFYTSLSETKKPLNLWSHSEGKVYFYNFPSAILLSRILLFESLCVGDLIGFKEQRSGIVFAKNRATRKSILTNAWTRHVVHYVSSSMSKLYLYPNRKFTRLTL